MQLASTIPCIPIEIGSRAIFMCMQLCVCVCIFLRTINLLIDGFNFRLIECGISIVIIDSRTKRERKKEEEMRIKPNKSRHFYQYSNSAHSDCFNCFSLASFNWIVCPFDYSPSVIPLTLLRSGFAFSKTTCRLSNNNYSP